MSKKARPDKVSFALANRALELIGTQGLHEFLLKIFPSHRVHWENASTIAMCCPVHGDNTPSCKLNTARGTIHCFGCSLRTRNILDFLTQALCWTYSESAAKIAEYTGVKLFTAAMSERLDAVGEHHLMMRGVFHAANCHLQWLLSPQSAREDVAGFYDVGMVESARPVLEWLASRKVDPTLVHNLPIGVLPPEWLLERLVKSWFQEERMRRRQLKLQSETSDIQEANALKRMQSMMLDLGAEWVGNVTFHPGHAFNMPGRMRIRKPTRDEKSMVVVKGYDEEESPGFFGLYNPYFNFPSADLKRLMIMVVEGEFDALSIMQGLQHKGENGVLVLASGGNANALDALTEVGFDTAYLVSDQPHHGGDTYLYERLQTAMELDVRVFIKWNELPNAKDPDDAVNFHGWETIYRLLVTNRDTSFVTTHRWAYTRATNSAQDLDPDDVRGLTTMAARFGKAVRNVAQRERYVQEIANALNIPIDPLRQEIAKAGETEEAFILRIAATLRNDFHVCFKEGDGKTSSLIMFHKARKRVLRLSVHDPEDAATALSNVWGEIPAYFQKSIGLPPHLQMDPDMRAATGGIRVKELHRELVNYLRFALQQINLGVFSRVECTEYGQGHFVIEDPVSDRGLLQYIVNGTKVYRMHWPDKSRPDMECEELEGPSDGPVVFNVGFDKPVKPWSKSINSVKDLQDAVHVDVKATAEKLQSIYREFWRFKHQDLDTKFLAYHLLAAAVPNAWAVPVIIAITADTSSGKSKLLSTMCGSTDPRIQFLELAKPLANFSMPAIYQGWNGSSMGLGADEFENEDGNYHKAQQVENTSEILRNVISESGSMIARGGKDGNTKEYNLKMFVFLASILNAKKAQDENRRFSIELDKVKGLSDPRTGLLAKYSLQEIADLRRSITIGLLPHVHRLREAYQLIERECAKGLVPFPVDSRFLQNFYPACAVMELVGEDWRKFIKDVCTARKAKLQGIAAQSTSQVLYDRLMSSPAIPVGQSRKSVSDFLGQATYGALNETGCGFFYIEHLQLAVVHWIMAQSPTGVIGGWREYQMMSHRSLKDTLDRHSSALRTEEYESRGVLAHMRRTQPDVRPHNISVLNLAGFMKELQPVKPKTPDTAAIATAVAVPPVTEEVDDGIANV